MPATLKLYQALSKYGQVTLSVALPIFIENRACNNADLSSQPEGYAPPAPALTFVLTFTSVPSFRQHWVDY